DSGWHFGATNTTTKKLEVFSIEDMARDMEGCAPGLWRMLGVLFDGEASKTNNENGVAEGDITMGDDDSYWDEIDEIDLEGFINGLTADRGLPPSAGNKRSRRQAAIVMIRKTVVIATLMASVNQKANVLQSILGIFFQSTH
ncbi:hypothetical protein HYDPIDRAFT_72446, partial [Hydnomerulius pinastri MD-312]